VFMERQHKPAGTISGHRSPEPQGATLNLPLDTYLVQESSAARLACMRQAYREEMRLLTARVPLDPQQSRRLKLIVGFLQLTAPGITA